MTQFITIPPKVKNITGQRFGRLVALGPVRRSQSRQLMWLCQCDCGNYAEIVAGSLYAHGTRSCGCLACELSASRNATHGKRSHRLYHVWRGAKARCTSQNDPSYANYGGRGITFSDEWMDDFQAFFDYVTSLPHCGEKGYSLDRIDNSLGYAPGNVRWATSAEQLRNTRIAIMLTHAGKTQCITAWAEELQIRGDTLHRRLRRGWSVERALTEPVNAAYSHKKR